MGSGDRAEFAKIIKLAFAMNPKWVMPAKDGIEMWWRCLEAYAIEQVSYGFEAHLKDAEAGMFQPTPASVIKHIEGGNKSSREARAEYAWRVVLDNLNTYTSVVFDDPAIHYAIAIAFGSWVKLGQTSEDAMPFARKDFVKAYLAYKHGLPYQKRLAGILEQNTASGESVFSVEYVGDKEKCLAVETGGIESGFVPLSEITSKVSNAIAR